MRTLLVAGVMSGTSADGVDVALCRIAPPRAAEAGGGGSPRLTLIGHHSVKYPKALRAAVLAAMDAKAISTADLSRLHWRLGEIYADAVERAATKFSLKPALIALHGQTLYHQGVARPYLGRPVRATWQIGEASVLAERLRVPVVSDFRPADLAAGGQGAPLVPMLDYTMFRSPRISRVLQNLGGIGNLTAIPAGASVDRLLAFDTGPANMVIDECMERLFGRPFDKGGAVAKSGQVLADVVAEILRTPYFSAPPPKSCGREQFGEHFTSRFIALCRKAGGRSRRDADIVATATALTAESVLDAYRRHVWSYIGQAAPLAKVEFIVAGGGAKNTMLMNRLRAGLEPLGVKVRPMEELGVPSQAKEAVAFALLGWLTWHGLPGNVPAATGASRPVILGRVTPA